MAENKKKTLLLHSCCGPCSTACIERLADEYEITVFYYNPCITHKEEYEKRKREQIRFLDDFNRANVGKNKRKISFTEGEYLPEKYFKKVKGLEDEPEGGKRCKECFTMRLEETALQGKNKGYDFFTTTLTVSPHKNYPLIASIGKECQEKFHIDFLDMDFKKQDGYKRSVDLSKEYGLYRQNYCGCEFSKWFLKGNNT